MKNISLIILMIGIWNTVCYGQQTDTTIYSVPDIQPIFKYDTCSSSVESISKYFIDKYKLPSLYFETDFAGIILIEFVIEKDSTVSNVKVLRGIDEKLDVSVKETFKSMPKWIPGIFNGKTVRTKYKFPVTVHLLHGMITE